MFCLVTTSTSSFLGSGPFSCITAFAGNSLIIFLVGNWNLDVASAVNRKQMGLLWYIMTIEWCRRRGDYASSASDNGYWPWHLLSLVLVLPLVYLYQASHIIQWILDRRFYCVHNFFFLLIEIHVHSSNQLALVNFDSGTHRCNGNGSSTIAIDGTYNNCFFALS